MSRLLSLYPRAWRERYEAEVTDLIASRPLSIGDRFDLVRGAADARLHPQVVPRTAGSAADDGSRQPLAALAATLGGLLWILGGVAMHTAGFGPDGYKEAEVPWLLLFAGGLLCGVAAVSIGPAVAGRTPVALAVAAAMIGSVFLLLTPWPLLVVGFFGFCLSALLFGALIARGSTAGVGVGLVIASLLLLGFNTQNALALLAIPFGLAWIAVAASQVRRPPVPTPV